MIKTLDMLSYFELDNIAKEGSYTIPTVDNILENRESIPYTKVWVSDVLNNEYIDTKHYVYDIQNDILIQTYNSTQVDSVILVKEPI